MTEDEVAHLFPTFERELVQELVAVASVRTMAEGDVLMRSGQNIRAALLVLHGLLKIYREDDDGSEYFMYYLDGGKACSISLVCALGQQQSALSAKAIKASTVISIPLQYVDAWMGRYKSWAQFSVSTYRERFDELLQTIDHIAFRNMDERLLNYLRRHQQQFGENTLATPFTEIAHDLNSSREVVSRLMKKLSEKGIIELHRTHVTFLDLDKAMS